MGRPNREPGKLHTDDEIGVVKKDWRNRIRVALVYPNRYHVGIANLGLQTVYHLFNQMGTVLCERAFLPAPGRGRDRLPTTLESRRALKEFDIVAFAVSFENDYLNILRILKLSGLPLKSAERNAAHPLILAGGVACQLNPEPLAPFMDLFLMGEAELLLSPFIEVFEKFPARDEFLEQLARSLPGAYIPRFYRPAYGADGTLAAFTPRPPLASTVPRVYLEDLSRQATVSTIITPHTTFASPYLVEVGRGCPHGCRFCSAGYIYRPPRFRPLSLLEECLDQGRNFSRRIGLVGAAVSDLPDIGRLCRKAAADNLQLAFSSLRADALTPELAAALAASGVKTATMAPDAGSPRLRRVINKGITAKDLLRATEILVAHGIPNLKLYFMIGLPTETAEDIDALVDLSLEVKARFLKASRVRGRMGTITVSISSFVPKPFTPFQWAGMATVPQLKTKLKTIKRALGPVANIRVHSDSPRGAWIQALLARGDRRAADILALALKYDGNWTQALKAAPVDPAFFIERERGGGELFPWDFIDHGVKKSFLYREYQKARENQLTPPCPTSGCHRCGVCPPPGQRDEIVAKPA